jgi:hypothetical protein
MRTNDDWPVRHGDTSRSDVLCGQVVVVAGFGVVVGMPCIARADGDKDQSPPITYVAPTFIHDEMLLLLPFVAPVTTHARTSRQDGDRSLYL